KLSNAEGGRHFILDDLDTSTAAHDILTLFDGVDTADVEADRGVELKCFPASGDFRVAKHDADFFTELIGEDDGSVRVADGGGEFTHSLAHETSLQADVGVTHFAFDFGTRCEGGHGVDDDDIDGITAHEGIDDLEGLLTSVGLR